jgi:hypothetical protein
MLISKKTTDQNQIDAPESDYLYTAVSKLSNSGNGLFSAIDIYKDEIIAIFYGLILTNQQAALKAKKGKTVYFMNLPNGKILDCESVNGFAKYANDASVGNLSGFKNKSKITLDEHQNVCLVAISKIKAGEEIFCSYGKKYWAKHATPIL